MRPFPFRLLVVLACGALVGALGVAATQAVGGLGARSGFAGPGVGQASAPAALALGARSDTAGEGGLRPPSNTIDLARGQSLALPELGQDTLLARGRLSIGVRPASRTLEIRVTVRSGRRSARLPTVWVPAAAAAPVRVVLSLNGRARKLIRSCDPATIRVRGAVASLHGQGRVLMRRVGGVEISSHRCPAVATSGLDRKPMILDIGPEAVYDVPLRRESLDYAAASGVDAVRVIARWAPTVRPGSGSRFDTRDPGASSYDFWGLDGTIRDAHERGLGVLLTITGPVPSWAGTDPGSDVDPDPAAFGDFAAAIAARYNGDFAPHGASDPLPAVQAFSVWNEPNLSMFLGPQTIRGAPASPILYRRLYLAAQASIEEAAPDRPILIGETAPTGGKGGVEPVTFARGVLCLTAQAQASSACNSGHIDAVGWAAHPYSLLYRKPFEPSKDPDQATIGDLTYLEGAIRDASEAGTLPAELPIWITESGFESQPDPRYPDPSIQADMVSIIERLSYEDPHVVTVGQYLLRDEPDGGGTHLGFETGLFFADGTPKPAASSFRLPLAVHRRKQRVQIWGLVRPSDGPADVVVRALDPDGYTVDLFETETSPGGIFTADSAYVPGRVYQLIWKRGAEGDEAGPWTHMYPYLPLPQLPPAP